MKNKWMKSVLLFCAGVMMQGGAINAAKTAIVRVNGDVKYQKVTGFGGFVNSPQFAYNHMSEAEIRKLWGNSSEMGYNIMRIYLPIGQSNWSQSLATAKLAKQLGVKLFASPWSMPAEWKTNNDIRGYYTDVDGVEQIGKLKPEFYDEYAQYLNDYVVYLRNEGVELDGISIQNEPDYKVEYAGCMWTPDEIAGFVRDYGSVITCPIIAAEGVGITNNYAAAFLPDAIINELGIFGGHQYGALQTSGFQQLQAKGKEVWMTEFLINWNANQATTRSFNWSVDAFDFANSVNTAMVGNINAWVHYAAKRYYGLMGDGQFGTTTGVITKRGYILSHFSKYVTGTTRVEHEWRDDSGVLKGSTYLSENGEDVVVMVINSSNETYDLTVDLPFYTIGGNQITTSSSKNMSTVPVSFAEETCRPKVTLDASGITTLVFRKSSVRPASQMTGGDVYYHKMDDQFVTNVNFGTGYQMSGKTFIFKNDSRLISSQTSLANGYLQLDDRYNQLVFHVDNITSAMSFTSANTTLYYVNANGVLSSKNYGTISFDANGNFDWVLDISRNVLPDGCIGVVGLSNGNYTSVLTMTFGNVYFRKGNAKASQFTGVYSKGDSDLLDCLDNSATTSLDLIATTDITADLDWHATAANSNCLFYLADGVSNSHSNVIAGNSCSQLLLSGDGGFDVPFDFSATTASYTRTFSGYGMMILPFAATIPDDVKVYTIVPSATEMSCTPISDLQIPANTPVLVVGSGTFTFEGSGSVSTPAFLSVSDLLGVYVTEKAPAGSYVLKSEGGTTTFRRVVAGQEPMVAPFSAYLFPSFAVSELSLPLKAIGEALDVEQIRRDNDNDDTLYDLLGRPVHEPKKGVVYIKGGKRVIF